MKTSTLLIAAGAVGAFVLLAKVRKDGLGDADMLLPPPGRTVTASGQVLGDLGMLTTYQDAYDAAPSQYNLRPRNDFVPGLGAFLRGRPSPGAGRRSGLFSRAASIRDKINAGVTAKVKAETAKKAKEAEDLRMAALAQQKVNETLLAIQKRAEEEAAAEQVRHPKKPKPFHSGQFEHFETKPMKKGTWGIAQRLASRQAGAKPFWAAVANAGTMTREGANKAAWEKNAAQRAADIPSPVITQPPAVQPPTVAQPPAASTYEQAQQAYDVMAAAREQASMSSASSDTGYGRTWDDTGYGSTQQVTEEGAPRLPERVASVQTPAAMMLPEAAPPAAPSGDSKVGLLVGGGVLAAIAAAMAV